MARPQIEIDPKLVEKLAEIHCTMIEIASVVGCSVDTLERRFADIIKAGKDKGKASLRRFQWNLAQKGNATMCVWLGKNVLGQREKSDEEYEKEKEVRGLVVSEEMLRNLTKQSMGEVNGSNGSKANSGKDSEEIAKPH